MVEVFSGSGRLAKSFSQLGFSVVVWDIKQGAEFDVTQPSVLSRLRRLICGADFVHFAPPCGSFSIARRSYVLRSRKYPLGKPRLNTEDQARVDIGNKLMSIVCELCLLLVRKHIPFSLEQPASSRLWLCPQIRTVEKMIGDQKYQTTF